MGRATIATVNQRVHPGMTVQVTVKRGEGSQTKILTMPLKLRAESLPAILWTY